MADWDDPIQRAAVWYLAVFGSAAVLVLTGVNVASFSWDHAAHPLGAVAAIGATLLSCLIVVGLAARVLVPRWTLDSLIERQRKAERSAPFEERAWPGVARRDKVLVTLVERDFFLDEGYAPISARRTAFDETASPGDRRLGVRRCSELVTAANHHAVRSAFAVLRWTTPVAAAIVVSSVAAWGTVAAPRMNNVASPSHPIPVEVQLNPTVDPRSVVGAGCTRAALAGIAISGTLSRSPVVAITAQGDCPARLLTVTPAVGGVTRRD